jgi:hypothetical protein
VLSLPNLNIWRNKLDSLNRQIKKLGTHDEVQLDIGKNSEIKPQGLVMLALICQLIYERIEKPVGFYNLKHDTRQRLASLGFFDFPFAGVKTKFSLFNIANKRNPLIDTKLTLIRRPSDVSTFNNNINDLICACFPKASYLKSISTIIAELCNNSLEHSRGYGIMGECYCAVQKYVYSGRSSISICIGDIGLGIRQHLKLKYPQLLNSDVDCIKKVLNGFSGRQDGSGGMGIPFIRDKVNSYRGQFHIRSGRGLVEFGDDNGIRKFESITSFPGTQSLIIIIQ